MPVKLPLTNPDPTFVVVDPGGRNGVLLREPGKPWVVTDVDLDDLPILVAGMIGVHKPAFVCCEDYSLTGGNQRNSPKVPAAIGKGIVWGICSLLETDFVLLQRGVKHAGHTALDEDGKVAFSTARNDHRRDVVDLAGYVLREIRVHHHNLAR